MLAFSWFQACPASICLFCSGRLKIIIYHEFSDSLTWKVLSTITNKIMTLLDWPIWFSKMSSFFSYGMILSHNSTKDERFLRKSSYLRTASWLFHKSWSFFAFCVFLKRVNRISHPPPPTMARVRYFPEFEKMPTSIHLPQLSFILLHFSFSPSTNGLV